MNVAKAVSFVAVVFTALALVPGGAHLFALPNKIGMPQEAYFIAQTVYNGWALFGLALFGALAANLALALILHRQAWPCALAAFSFVCVAATLAIFFVWVYPVNQATVNWTMAPANWDALRRQWEYGHAVDAVLTFVGFCAVTLATLTAEWSRAADRPARR